MSETAGILGLTDRVRAEIHRHVFDNPDREVGGVLVGQRVGEQAVQVMGMIAALEAEGHAAAVTFTHKAWEVVHRELDRRFPEMQIVGWYHSHPGFGIFLSRDDLFIHESFFSKPWQFAYVIDPIGLEEGEFGWSGGSVELIQTRPIEAPSGFRPPATKARQTISTAAEPGVGDLEPRRSRYPLAGILAPLAIGAVLGFLVAPAFGLGDDNGPGQAAVPSKKARGRTPARAASDSGPSRAPRTIEPAPDRPVPPIDRSTVPATKESAAAVEKEEAPETIAPSPSTPNAPAEEVEAGGTIAPESGGVGAHFNDD
jgi:proteasome lid subunit RPN8/RPN11